MVASVGVNKYLIKLENVLRNVPYLRDIVKDHILPNISTSYVKWINNIESEYMEWKSYKDLFDLLRNETHAAFENFVKHGTEFKKMDKPSSGGATNDKPTKSKIGEITGDKVKPKSLPKEGEICDICDKKFTKNEKLKHDEQNHGFPSNYSGKIHYCPDWDKEANKGKVESLCRSYTVASAVDYILRVFYDY